MAGMRLCALVCALLIAPAHSYITKTIQSLNLQPQTCGAIPVTFGFSRFGYNAYITGYTKYGSECNQGNFNISKLYMAGTCIPGRDNNFPGCRNQDNGASPSQGACSLVFKDTGVSIVRLSTVSSTSVSRFDRGTVCNGQVSTGYFYLANNCPITGESGNQGGEIKIQVDIDNTYSCGRIFPRWASATTSIIGIAVLCLALCCVFSIMRKRRMSQAQQQGPYPMGPPQAVPMGNYPQQGGYNGYPQQGGPPRPGGAPPGYPQQAPAYGYPVNNGPYPPAQYPQGGPPAGYPYAGQRAADDVESGPGATPVPLPFEAATKPGAKPDDKVVNSV